MLYVNSIPTPRMCIVGKKTTDIYNVGLRGYNAYKALHFLVIVYNIFSRWRINFIIKHLTHCICTTKLFWLLWIIVFFIYHFRSIHAIVYYTHPYWIPLTRSKKPSMGKTSSSKIQRGPELMNIHEYPVHIIF